MPRIPNDNKSYAAHSTEPAHHLDGIRSPRQWQGREIILLPEDEKRININDYLDKKTSLQDSDDPSCFTVIREDCRFLISVDNVKELAKAFFKNNNLIFEIMKDERKDILELLLLLKIEEKSFVEDILSSKGEDNYSPVQQAVISGHIDLLPILHQLGANFEKRDLYGNTLAHLAVRHGRIAVLEALKDIDAGALCLALQVRNHDGITPMGLAALEGKEAVLDIANELNLDFNEKNQPFGNTLAHLAAQNGHVGFLRRLKKLQPDTNFQAKNNDRQTPMCSAAFFDHEQCVHTLNALDPHIDLRHKDKHGSTATHYAAEKGHTAVLEALRDMNAEALRFTLQEQNHDGITPMGLAALEGKEAVLDIAKSKEFYLDFNEKNQRLDCTLAHLAAQNGHVGFLQRLKELQPDTNFQAKNSNRQTPMHSATFFDHEKCVRTLKELDPHIDLRHKDEHGYTVTHYAAKKGHTAVLEALRDVDAKGLSFTLQEQDHNGITPMGWAALEGKEAVLDIANELNLDFNETNQPFGNTLVHLAVQNGHVGFLRRLKELQPDTNFQAENNDGQTPMYSAAFFDHEQCVHTLNALDPHIDLRRKDKYGYTATHYAAKKGHTAVLEALRDVDAKGFSFTLQEQDHNGITPMGWTALEGKEAVLDIAKEFHLDFNEKNQSSGNTLAHLAAQNGRGKFLRRLKKLQLDTNFQAENNDGQTPMYFAVFMNHEKCVHTLKELDPHIDLRHKDKHGYTATHFAAEKGHTAVLEALKDVNAVALRFTLQEQNHDGFTPMGLAALGGKKAVLDIANEFHLDFNEKNQRLGNTLAHLAALKGHVGFLRRLKELQPDTNFQAENDDGKTPMHSATFFDHEKCVRALKELDPHIDLRHKDKHGKTATHYAAEKGHTAVLEALEDVDAEALRFTLQEQNHGDLTPMELAALEGREAVLDFAKKFNLDFNEKTQVVGNTLAHLAVQNGHVGFLRRLKELQPDTNFQAENNDGQTPMYSAAFFDHEQCVHTLNALDPHIDLRRKDKYGYTATHYAAKKGHAAVLEALRDVDAKGLSFTLQEQDHNGITPMGWAALEGKEAVLDIAKEFHLDFNEKNQSSGNTLAHLAAQNGRGKFLRRLKKLQLDTNFQAENNDGQTPMYFAVFMNHEKCVHTLKELDPHIDLRHKDKHGSTSTHFAAEKGHTAVLEALKDVNAVALRFILQERNHDGFTPMDLAAFEGKEAVLDIANELHLDFNEKNQLLGNATLAHLAAQNGHVEFLRRLKELQPDTNFLIQNLGGRTILDTLLRSLSLQGYHSSKEVYIGLFLLLNAEEQKFCIQTYQENFRKMMVPAYNPLEEERVIIEVHREGQDGRQQNRYFQKLLEVQDHLPLRRIQVHFQEDPQSQDVGGPAREFLTLMQNENDFKEYFCGSNEGIFLADDSDLVIGLNPSLTPKRREKIRLFTHILNQMYLQNLPLMSIQFSPAFLRTLAPTEINVNLAKNTFEDNDDVASLESHYAYAKYDPYDQNMKNFYQDNGLVNREWIRAGLSFGTEDEYIEELKSGLKTHMNALMANKQFVLNLLNTKFGLKFHEVEVNGSVNGLLPSKIKQESAETLFLSQIAPSQDLAKIFLTDEDQLTNRLEFTVSPHARADSAPSPEQVTEVKQAFKSYLLSIKNDEQKLKDFVEAFTGSPLLSESKNLQIMVQEEILGERPIFIHTCFYNADFSYKAFKDAQERGLSAQDYLAGLIAVATGYQD